MPKGSSNPLAGFSGDWFRLMGPLVSERAVELARQRIAAPKTRLVTEGGVIPTGDAEMTVKVSLMLVLQMNPLEDLTCEEQGVLRGISAKTVGKRIRADEI